MQQLLVNVTRQPFPELMAALVLAPAGITSSTYDQLLPSDKELQPASGHDGEGHVIEGKWPIQPEMAAAGLWTTPTDLAKWALAISAAWDGSGGTLLSQQVAAEMLTVQKAPYGLGVEVQGSGHGNGAPPRSSPVANRSHKISPTLKTCMRFFPAMVARPVERYMQLGETCLR